MTKNLSMCANSTTDSKKIRKKKCSMFHVSHVKCQASLVTCHLSHVTWHVSPDDYYIQLHLKKRPRIFDNMSEGVLVIDIDLKNKTKKVF